MPPTRVLAAMMPSSPIPALVRLLAWLVLLIPAPGYAKGAKPEPAAPPAREAPGRPGVMLRDDALRANPDASAPALLQLRKGANLRLLKGEGGWNQVYAEGRTGWVRILSMRVEAKTDVDMGALAGLNKESDPGRVVAVAGGRGLNKVELRSARFDEAELALLDAYLIRRDEAEAYARGAGLARRSLDYLPAPDRPAADSSGFSWP